MKLCRIISSSSGRNKELCNNLSMQFFESVPKGKCIGSVRSILPINHSQLDYKRYQDFVEFDISIFIYLLLVTNAQLFCFGKNIIRDRMSHNIRDC